MSVKKSIKVPGELVQKIDRYIERSKGFFRSRPEVVTAALERFFKQKRQGRKKRKP